jgi:CBS domain-containing protein
MKIAEIMNREPICVRKGQTFGEAFRILTECGHGFLPVVDDDGVYCGNFELRDVWSAVLPKAVRLRRQSIEDLSFLPGSMESMQDRLAGAADAPVMEYVTRADAPPIAPETPLIQGILMLDEFREALAVVDPKTKKLVWIFGAKDVLKALR